MTKALYGYLDPYERDVLESVTRPLHEVLGILEISKSAARQDGRPILSAGNLAFLVEEWMQENPGNRTGLFVPVDTQRVHMLPIPMLTQYSAGVPLDALLEHLSHGSKLFPDVHGPPFLSPLRSLQVAQYIEQWYWQGNHPIYEPDETSS